METKAQLRTLTDDQLAAKLVYARSQRLVALNNRNVRLADKIWTLQTRILEVQAERSTELARKARNRALDVALRRARRS